jgi:hypothetical protein
MRSDLYKLKELVKTMYRKNETKDQTIEQLKKEVAELTEEIEKSKQNNYNIPNEVDAVLVVNGWKPFPNYLYKEGPTVNVNFNSKYKKQC